MAFQSIWREHILQSKKRIGERVTMSQAPFLKNVWYVAAFASELTQEFVSRTICNRRILMYRTSDGSVAALDDLCPHRFVPLSMGKRLGDTVQCGYHGLTFGADGTCVRNPNEPGSEIRANICVRSYPVVERHAAVWIWMGDPALAASVAIPDFSFMAEDKRFAAPTGYCHMRASIEVVADNLLDLSHVHYLHPGVHEGSDFASFHNEVKQEGDTLWSMLWRPRYYLTEDKRSLWGMDAEWAEGQGHTRWNAPGVLAVYSAFWKQGESIERGVEVPSAHLLTPETETTTHYFWSSARTHDIDDREFDAKLVPVVKNIFETQDAPMLEAQQAYMGQETDLLKLRPVVLKPDTAGLTMRRMLKRMRRQEAEDAAPSAVAAE
jgi:Phenylpropionate dioxygenase and related ring-hydroxylating dioxygenases, large terminal subunit